MKVKPRFILIMLLIGVILGGSVVYILLPTKTNTQVKIKPVEVEKVDYRVLKITEYKNMNIHEIKNLLSLVEAEATGGTVRQKRNVAHVVLNQVASSSFPNSINDVIFQDKQFSCIHDGRFTKVKISDETVNAVQQAISGIDKHNSTFFMNRAGSDKDNIKWFDNSLHQTFNDGIHEFFKED